MNPALSEIAAALDDSRRALLAAAEGMDDAALAARPGPGEWSVGEVLHHVAIVERRVAGMAARLLEEGIAAGLPPARAGMGSVLGSLDAFSVPVVRKPLKTTSAQPEHGLSLAELRRELDGARAAVLGAMEAADPYDLSGLRAAHPALGDLSLYQWLVFIPQHEQRHAAQARRVRDAVLASGPARE